MQMDSYQNNITAEVGQVTGLFFEVIFQPLSLNASHLMHTNLASSS